MRNLSGTEITECDNDWYCTINNKPVHIASMCGNIPRAFRNISELRSLQESVRLIEHQTEALINQELINAEIEGKYTYLQDRELRELVETLNVNDDNVNYNLDWPLEVRLYSCSFIDKARKGFYSYARIGQTNEWFQVAYPNEIINLNEYSLNLRALDIRVNGELPLRFYMPE